MRFIVDAQLPARLARSLTLAGHPSQAVRDLDLGNADDESIWNYAATHQLVIITKDEDFANRIAQTSHGPAVVWLRLGNCSNRLLLEQLMPMVEDIVERIRLGDQLIEVS